MPIACHDQMSEKNIRWGDFPGKPTLNDGWELEENQPLSIAFKTRFKSIPIKCPSCEGSGTATDEQLRDYVESSDEPDFATGEADDARRCESCPGCNGTGLVGHRD